MTEQTCESLWIDGLGVSESENKVNKAYRCADSSAAVVTDLRTNGVKEGISYIDARHFKMERSQDKDGLSSLLNPAF